MGKITNLLPPFFMGEVPELLRRRWGPPLLRRNDSEGTTRAQKRTKSARPHRAPRGAHFPHKKWGKEVCLKFCIFSGDTHV